MTETSVLKTSTKKTEMTEEIDNPQNETLTSKYLKYELDKGMNHKDTFGCNSPIQ